MMSFLEHRKLESRKYILLITVPTIVLCFLKAGIQQIFLNGSIYFSLYPCDCGETDIYIFKIEPAKKII